MVLQDIKTKFRLPDAYKDWEAYRNGLTDTVVSLRNENNSKTIAIYGAGYCNDIDISRLCESFEKVTLIDCDRDSIYAAFQKLDIKEQDKVELKSLSLTGIEEEDVSEFIEGTLAEVRKKGYSINTEILGNILSLGIERLNEKMLSFEKRLPNLLTKRDMVLCNGVCSQLFSQIAFFIRSLVQSIPESLLNGSGRVVESTEQKLKRMNDHIIPVICDAMAASANHYTVFGNEYDTASTVEGAGQCIEAVRNSKRMIREFETVWNFNSKEHIIYNMLIQICSP